jgi:hypothetical protein
LDAIGETLTGASATGDLQNLRDRLDEARKKWQSGGADSFAELAEVLADIASTLAQSPAGLDGKTSQAILDLLYGDIDPSAKDSPLSPEEFRSCVNALAQLVGEVKAIIGESHPVLDLFHFSPQEGREVAVVFRNSDGELMALQGEGTGDGIQVEGKAERLADFVTKHADVDIPLLVVPREIVSGDSLETDAELRASAASTDREMLNLKIRGSVYTVPAGALQGTDVEYAREAIERGLKSLQKIMAGNPDELRKNSPIHSRQDMADLMWALDAEAWKISPRYQASGSAMYVSDAENKIYAALLGAKDGEGKPFAYFRGGKNDSSHLQPFPNSKASQYGFNAYEDGASATDPREVKLPYGKNTLLFGKLEKTESGFGKNRSFIKLESYGTDSRGTGIKARWNSFKNLLCHGLEWFTKCLCGIDSSTRESNFTEKTTSIHRAVSSFCEEHGNGVEGDFWNGLKSAAERGLTALAQHVEKLKAMDLPPKQAAFLMELEGSINRQLEGSILKEHQLETLEEWQSSGEGDGQSALAYFARHDQSGREIILDL